MVQTTGYTGRRERQMAILVVCFQQVIYYERNTGRRQIENTFDGFLDLAGLCWE